MWKCGHGRATQRTRASAAKRATRTERAGEAASEGACRGVRGATSLGCYSECGNVDTAEPHSARERAQRNEPRERSEPAKRRARERVGESEGRRPSVATVNVEMWTRPSHTAHASERSETSHANGASRRSGERGSV